LPVIVALVIPLALFGWKLPFAPATVRDWYAASWPKSSEPPDDVERVHGADRLQAGAECVTTTAASLRPAGSLEEKDYGMLAEQIEAHLGQHVRSNPWITARNRVRGQDLLEAITTTRDLAEIERRCRESRALTPMH
jgi:hypothetical protein